MRRFTALALAAAPLALAPLAATPAGAEARRTVTTTTIPTPAAPLPPGFVPPTPVPGRASIGSPPPQARSIAFTQPEAIVAWIGAYRAHPEPERAPEAVHAMIATGLMKDFEQAGMYIGFVAGVLHDNPDKARALLGRMFPLPPEHQVVVIKAIAFSGLIEWKEMLAEFAERMPARRVLIDKYLYKQAPTLMQLPLDSGAFAIDANWGYFLATGSAEPVERIIKALAWTGETKNLERLTLAQMAKWTLASNAQRNTDLLAICKTSLAGQPKDIAAPLRDAIDAAETYELGRLRTAALKSIEELKAKGPETAGTGWRWWGEAGTTVLALGCVAASALGQAEVGIPCVIGGALATAGTKYLLPP